MLKIWHRSKATGAFNCLKNIISPSDQSSMDRVCGESDSSGVDHRWCPGRPCGLSQVRLGMPCLATICVCGTGGSLGHDSKTTGPYWTREFASCSMCFLRVRMVRTWVYECLWWFMYVKVASSMLVYVNHLIMLKIYWGIRRAEKIWASIFSWMRDREAFKSFPTACL